MSRTAFFRKIGAEFANQRWSWAAINHAKREVYFGAWDDRTTDVSAVILEEAWSSKKSRKSPGYSDALKKLHYVENEGYTLKVFKMVNGRLPSEDGPSKIKEIDEVLHNAALKKVGGKWIAVFGQNGASLADEIHETLVEHFREGAKKEIVVETVERNSNARDACIKHFGAQCVVCEANFGQIYGVLGEGFIHVHHLNPLRSIETEYSVDPIKDMVPLCPNCHAMVHRVNPPISPDDLKEVLQQQRGIQ